ncbi:MAG: hypothetical protein Q9191_002285, partial [Dirinaria sp. TL-2023a]
MAATGTSVPASSSTPNYIPSKPARGQELPASQDPNDMGSADLSGVAENTGDIPR